MSEQNEKKGQILVIDDTISVINMVRTSLMSEEYQVLIATSGGKGLQSAKLAQPDLILLDIMMPEMDGYEVCEKLKSDKITKDIPVIFMSALTETLDKVRAFQSGAIDYITKPINLDELLARVNTQVSLYKLHKKMESVNEYLEETIQERTSQLNEKHVELQQQYEALQATEEELKATNDELYNSIDKLETSESQYRELTEHLPDTVLTIDRNYKVLYANRTLSSISPDEIIGKNILDLDPNPDNKIAAKERIDKVFKTGESILFESELNTPDGIVNLKVSLNPIKSFNRVERLLCIISDITKEKQLEDEVVKSEERYRNFVNLSQHGIYRLELKEPLKTTLNFNEQVEWVLKNLYMAECNSFYARIFGYDNPDEVIGKSLPEFLGDKEKALNLVNKFINSGYSWSNLESLEILPDGTQKNMLNNVFAIEQDGIIKEIWGTNNDITKQKKAEDALANSEEALRKIIQNTAKVNGKEFFDATVKTMEEVSGADYSFIGKSIEGNKIETIALIHNGEFIENFVYDLKGTPCLDVSEGSTCIYQNDITNLFPDDQLLIDMGIEAYAGTPIHDGKGHFIGILVSLYKHPINNTSFIKSIFEIFASKISGEMERLKAEAALIESEERFQLAMQASNDGLFDWNLITNEVYYSPSWKKLIGYEDHELDNELATWEKFTDPETIKNANMLLDEHLKGKRDKVEFEFKMRHKKGGYVDILSRASAIFDKEGNAIRVVGTHVNITERKKAEKIILESEQRFRTLAENVPGTIYVCANDEHFTMHYLNDEILKLTGYSKEAFLNGEVNLPEIYHQDDDKHIREEVAKALNKRKPFKVEYRIQHKNGQWIWVEDFGAGIFEKDNLLHLEGIAIDITERKMQEQILSARLRLVDYAADHSVNQLLQKILDEAELLTESNIGFYHFLEDDQETLTLQAWSTNTLQKMCTAEGEGAHYNISKAGVWVDCVRKRRPVIHNSYENLKHKKGLPKGHAPVIRELVVPVFRENKIVAVLGVGNKPNNYINLDVRVVQQLADLAWEIVVRKQTEKTLRESENKFRRTFEFNPNIMILADIGSMTILDVNKAYTKILGYLPEEVIGITGKFGFSFGQKHEFIDAKNELLTDKKGVGKEVNIKTKSGEIRIGLVFAEPFEVKTKEVFLITVIDITERKEAQAEVLEERNRAKNILQGTNAGTWNWDFVKDEVEINSRWAEIIGYSKEDLYPLLIDTWKNSIHPDDSDRVSELLHEHLSGRTDYYSVEFRQKHKQGHWVWVHSRGKIIEYTNDGKPLRMYGTHLDITERKEAELALEQSYTKFKTLADYTYDWEYWKDTNENFIYVSPSCKRISGYQSHHFQENANLFRSIIHEDDRELWGNHEIEASRQIACEIPLEFRIKTKNGKTKWINHVCRPVYDQHGKHIGNRGTNRDITLQKLGQIALAESEYRFKQLSDLAMEGVVIHTDGIVENVNKSFLQMTGYSKSDIIGIDMIELLFKKHKKKAQTNMQQKYTKPYEVEIVRKNGKTIPVELTAKNISKTKNRRVVSVRDISEQKQMHQQILNAIIQTEEEERRRVAQELHDGLGPVLSTVKLYTQTYFSSDNEKFKLKLQEQLIHGIDEALEQVSSISNNLSPHVLSDFGIKVAIQKFIEKILKVKQFNINFTFDYLGVIRPDVETTLYRVCIELINNTVKHAQASTIDISFTGDEKNIEFIFENDGKEFDFDKIREKGKGMGLFNIVNRVKSLGGEVNFSNLQEQGIHYLITLPND